MHLLYSQAEVEDAVGAIGVAVRPSNLSDEAAQSDAQLRRVTLKDVLLNGGSTGCRRRRRSVKTQQTLGGPDEEPVSAHLSGPAGPSWSRL